MKLSEVAVQFYCPEVTFIQIVSFFVHGETFKSESIDGILASCDCTSLHDDFEVSTLDFRGFGRACLGNRFLC